MHEHFILPRYVQLMHYVSPYLLQLEGKMVDLKDKIMTWMLMNSLHKQPDIILSGRAVTV